jgi:hypothetical protein
MSLQASQLLRNLQSMPFSGSETSSNVDELSGNRVISGLCMLALQHSVPNILQSKTTGEMLDLEFVSRSRCRSSSRDFVPTAKKGNRCKPRVAVSWLTSSFHQRIRDGMIMADNVKM